MKYVCYCFLFVFMTCQFAHARYLEYVEYDDKADVYINGSRYVRVPYNSYKSVGYKKFKKLNKEDEDNYKINNKEAPYIEPYIGINYNIGLMNTKVPYLQLEDKRTGQVITEPKFIFDNDYKGFSGFLGLRVLPYLSVEIFYEEADNSKVNAYGYLTDFATYDVNTSFNYKAYGLDLIGNTAFDNQKLQLLFALGLANYNFEVEQSGAIYNETINNGNILEFNTKDGKDVTAVRIGSGFEYNFNDYIAFRSLFRYIHMLNDDFFKHMFELSMGLRFSM